MAAENARPEVTGVPMLIRAYRETDREVMRRITVEAFAGVSIDQNLEQRFGEVAGRDWRWRKARQIDDDLAADGAAAWVAEDEAGEVAGYVTARLDGAAGVGFIPNLAVRADQRGRGLGRRLIEHALEQFRAAGLEVVRIETLEQNPVGRHLYPACGFVEVARQVHYAVQLGPRRAKD
jgi:ribosomal protein S18 acetylase RimI-like enzyme